MLVLCFVKAKGNWIISFFFYLFLVSPTLRLEEQVKLLMKKVEHIRVSHSEEKGM